MGRSMVRAIALCAALCAGAGTAWAGRSCDTEPLKLSAVTQGLGLAERTVKRLDESGAQVVVLARSGQNLREYGLRYSHLGLAYKEGDTWRVLHKLNQCGTDKSSIYREGIGDFFLDTPYEYVAAVMPLNAEAQQKLLPLLRNPAPVAGLHTRAYSMVAYPWAQTYQQSNQWAIELLAVAMGAELNSRESAQDWLKDHGYEPTELHLSTLTRLGARLTAANVSFDDHPSVLRFTGRIRTVTVDSVLAWLQRTGLGGPEWVIR
ncbi:membrane protein [Aquabacterium sp. NJ1]|nr:DUF2145 domain-containing protein [Aquabacterium sp. NJ1]KGM41926.1 membrane protein [Aquabacterium sp. NJ1]